MNFLKKPASKPTAVAVPTPAATPAPAPSAKPALVAASGIEAKPGASKPAPAPAPLPAIAISQESIAQAAYFRWQRFGGDEATNWKLAEQELRDEAVKLGIKL